MEPYRRFFLVRERFVPGKNGVALAGNQTPVDGGHFVRFQYRQRVLEGAVLGPGHILGTEQRAAIAPESVDGILLDLAIAVTVIGDYVRIRQLELVELLQAVTPHSGGQGLGRSHFPGPFEGLLQEWKTA